MTQDILAERSGLSADTIRRLEQGGFSPSLETLRKLCLGLDVMLSTLFESFEFGTRIEHRELLDLVHGRSPREIILATRVLRALFDELDELASEHQRSVTREHEPDLADIFGLELPRKALEIAIAGGHHLLMHGPPGVGKTMLGRRIPGLLPPLEHEQAIEVEKLHELVRQPGEPSLRPPVRMPHHTVSLAGLLGGGPRLRFGEVMLAHLGVLFLDDLPEFTQACLDAVSEVLDQRVVTFVRGRNALSYPAQFLLIAAMRRCPCGFLGDRSRRCTDSDDAVERYQGRARAVLERMDIVVPVDPPPTGTLASEPVGDPSAVVRERILAARERQRRRLWATPWTRNAEIPADDGGAAERLCAVAPEARKLLDAAELEPVIEQRVRRVARTIDDLNPCGDPRSPISAEAVAFALELRPDQRLDAHRGRR